ncbi:MAG: hypothetical protein Q9218_002685 [Villophora microphyllina]
MPAYRAIDDVHRAIAVCEDDKKTAEGKAIVEGLAKLKYELQHNRPLTRMSTFFALSTHWKAYDVFARQKMSTFRSSRPAVLELAAKYKQLITQIRADSPKAVSQRSIEDAEQLLFTEMCEICLWGNATDLSLLTSLTYEDIQKLQGADARKSSEKNILVNNLPAAYAVLRAAQEKDPQGRRRVDIVLDNAGFELYVDFILAGYLLAAGLATEIVMHPKSIPWFVSDVLPADFGSLLSALADPQRFYSTPSDDEIHNVQTPQPLSEQDTADLLFLFQHWSTLHQEGQLVLRPNLFWTGPGSYWRLPQTAPSLYNDLQESELVIFKGDLNYRKLTGDAMWPTTTSFSTAIGPMGSNSGIRTLALRTCKADTVVGLPAGEDERIKATDDGAARVQGMSKLLKKVLIGAGEASSSSKVQQPPQATKADEDVARKLDAHLNGCPIENEHPSNGQYRDSGFPPEIQTAIDHVQHFAREILSTTCYKCEEPLIQSLDVPSWIQNWKATRQASIATAATGVRCKCGATTCLGCAQKPRLGEPKFMSQYEGMKLDWCCSKGGIFMAWVVLCEYDSMELSLQNRALQHRATQKQYPNQQKRGGGVGYGSGGMRVYWSPGLMSALNFKQVDAETDSLTKWILGMLIEILPKRNETSKKVNPALPSMIELSLLQDRAAQLLRNDSLQDVDNRAFLYFATFEFVSRLGNHPDFDYLVLEERFMKKQSAGLYSIATAENGKGKTKAQTTLTLAPKSEGMASSLISCLSKLATQSKFLLSGSNNHIAGPNILEVAKKVDKVYARLAAENSENTTITTWREYNQAHALTRRANVTKSLCAGMTPFARRVTSSAKGRMGRLVTEASELATSLPENIFVMVDDVRPDVMKDYPISPPIVWFLTTGQGRARFNPNLYDHGKDRDHGNVCLSLLGTVSGPPESQWQPYKSTILSVLVSIQAMILWDRPWENVPGLEGATASSGAAFAKEYNEFIKALTIKYAMLDWMRLSGMRDGLWRGVIRDYFKFCGKSVVECARKWEKNLPCKPGRRSWAHVPSHFGNDVVTKNLVDELEATVERFRKQ